MYMALMRVLREGTTTMGETVGHCNIPLLNDFFEDAFFDEMGLSGTFYRSPDSLTAFQSALDQIPWTPDLIMIFSGYDAHQDECGKDITNWTDREYELLTKRILDLARKASCPVLSVHGGGYKLSVTISAAVSHIQVLASYS
jgi:acetoin utilization deacetylase AcuC-like enzyme